MPSGAEQQEGGDVPECLEQTVRAAPVITHHRLSGESTSGTDVFSPPALGTVAARDEEKEFKNLYEMTLKKPSNPASNSAHALR